MKVAVSRSSKAPSLYRLKKKGSKFFLVDPSLKSINCTY